MAIKTLGYFTNNQFVQSKTDKYYPVFNPSTGEQIAQMPRCTTDEIAQVIDNAHEAYKKWSRVPSKECRSSTACVRSSTSIWTS